MLRKHSITLGTDKTLRIFTYINFLSPNHQVQLEDDLNEAILCDELVKKILWISSDYE